MRPTLDRPVFVVGPPRSGTTVVRVALNRHPDLHVATETHLHDLWVARHPGIASGQRAAVEAYWAAFTDTDGFRWLGLAPDAVLDRLVAWDDWDTGAVMTALLDATRDVHGGQRVGEKTPDHARHLDAILRDFPDARVLYVVRDPRATVASELRLERDWASDDPDVAARRWAAGVAPYATWGDDERVHLVRYEDLVTRPEATLRAACEHLALPWDDAVLTPGPGHPDYRHGDQDPWAGIGTASLDTWRDELTPAALLATARHAGPGAALLGYPDPAAEVPLRARVAAAPRALRRLAGRARRRMVEAGP